MRYTINTGGDFVAKYELVTAEPTVVLVLHQVIIHSAAWVQFHNSCMETGSIELYGTLQ